MGTMAERLNSMVIRVESSDGRFTASYNDTNGLGLSFRHNGYREYSERELERQLAQVINHVRLGYRRGFETALSEALGMPFDRPSEVADARQRRFRAERDATVMEGMSSDGYVYIRHTGGRAWQVVVRDGTLHDLDETRFGAAVAGAYHHAWRDCDVKTARLREKHFGARIAAHSRPSARFQTRKEAQI